LQEYDTENQIQGWLGEQPGTKKPMARETFEIKLKQVLISSSIGRVMHDRSRIHEALVMIPFTKELGNTPDRKIAECMDNDPRSDVTILQLSIPIRVCD
jgi:hypothetical protein